MLIKVVKTDFPAFKLSENGTILAPRIKSKTIDRLNLFLSHVKIDNFGHF